MLYNERVISDTTPSVGIYEGNQGQAYFMKEGERLKDEAAKEIKQAEQIEEKAHKLNLSQGMNNLANNDQLMNNPQALGTELDKLAKGIAANIKNEEMRLNILTDYELDKMSYLNKATANMKRIQAENARATTYDSVYNNLESLSLSFSNGVSGQGDENDVTNFQYSLAKLRENANARNLDGTFMFTEAQRRAIIKDADSSLMAGFLDSYSKMSDSQRASVRSRLQNDYFNIAVKKPDFKYRGNISLDRPVYKNADGTVSSERTITVTYGDKNYIIPTIRTEGGKRVDMTPEEAMNWFEKTGEHLGSYGKGEEKELRKAEEGIHSRYEGVDLRDVVGEKVYNDIKRNINKFEAAVLHQQKMIQKQQREAALEDFSSDPTESKLDYLLSTYAFTKNKKAELQEILDNTPNYDAVTTFKDATELDDSFEAFVNGEFGSSEEAMDKAIGLIYKAGRSQNKGNFEMDHFNAYKNKILTALKDEQVRTAMQELSGYRRSFKEATFDILSGNKRNTDYTRGVAEKTIERNALLATYAFDALVMDGKPEEAKKLLDSFRKKNIILATPELAGKEIGDRFTKNGLVWEVTGENSFKRAVTGKNTF